MSFFLTDEQEDALNLFLDEQNRKVCEQQLESETLPEELKEIVTKTMEAGSPIPAFDPTVGYYSISFTPTEDGNRIYVHHHLADVSYPIYDPLQQVTEEETPVSEPEVISEDFTFVDDQYTESAVDELALMNGTTEGGVTTVGGDADPSICQRAVGDRRMLRLRQAKSSTIDRVR